MRIGIVTDSTADLPLEYYTKNDVVMVPLTVHFGDEVYKDWTDMPPDRFYPTMEASVAAGILPKTSQPPAGDFVETYNDLATKGVDHIVSIHISAKLSGTLQSAKGATGIFKTVPVTLIDSENTALLMGSFVKELVAARDAGADADELVAVANRCKEWGRMYFTVKTLKYLELGGRIGKASALLGTLLSVKPLLTLEDGAVNAKGKASGAKKAMTEIANLVKGESDKRPADYKSKLILAYTDNPEVLDLAQAAVDAAGVKYDSVERGQVGSVIGTYVGPGAYMIGIL
ncbi:MAG: DegV family protein [Actinomycetota bacterium]